MLFAVKNLNIYQNNPCGHAMNTRQQNKLHVPYDFPQYRDVSTIHLLKYSTGCHKIY